MPLLRPQLPDDLPLLGQGDNPFGDFGPRSPKGAPAPASLDADGSLTVVADDGRVAGDVGWRWQQWGPNASSRGPMIGIWLRADHRGLGLGTWAQAELAQLFFRHTLVHRVEASTDVENVAEQRALDRAGFRREGTLRGAQWRDGDHRDCYLYSRLRTDRP